MRLLEAIIAANHAAIDGRRDAAEFDCFGECLPLAVLTCIDPRLNKLFPGVLGLKDEQFIWLRNAGNVITSTTSSTVRSIAVATLIKGAREIAVIGHTDCAMSKIGMADLLGRLQTAGINRTALPIPNLHDFFGLFSSEKPNVLKAVGYLRSSPIIPPKIPVHGLLIDTNTGRLDWVVNGYESAGLPQEKVISLGQLVDAALPADAPGYVSGPLKSLAENIEPLVAKKWEQAAEKISMKLASHVKPPTAPPPVIAGKNRKPPLKRRDKGPFR